MPRLALREPSFGFLVLAGTTATLFSIVSSSLWFGWLDSRFYHNHHALFLLCGWAGVICWLAASYLFAQAVGWSTFVVTMTWVGAVIGVVIFVIALSVGLFWLKDAFDW